MVYTLWLVQLWNLPLKREIPPDSWQYFSVPLNAVCLCTQEKYYGSLLIILFLDWYNETGSASVFLLVKIFRVH